MKLREPQLFTKFKEKCPEKLGEGYSATFKRWRGDKNGLKVKINDRKAYIFIYRADDDWELREIPVGRFDFA